MIDIDEVKNLEELALEQRVESDRKRQKANLESYDASRKQILKEMDEGRILAEKRFPNVLKEIDMCIKSMIKQNDRCVFYNCTGENDWDTQYLQIMLLQALPLKGLICRMHKNNWDYLNITW